MLQIAVLNDKLAFSPQITPAQVSEIAKLGYEQLIGNRPDHEEMGQPLISDIEAAAKSLGLSFTFAPVVNSQFTLAVIETTAQALENDKKTLIFCRSGTRSSILWAIIQTRLGKPLDETFAQLSPIGYDIAYLEDFINACAQQ